MSIDGKGLDDVSVYVENALIDKTDLDGTLDLKHTIPVKIILIKAGFEERSVTLHEDENEIVLYDIGIRDLRAVEIVKFDMYKEFKQLLVRTKAANLIYVYKVSST